MFKKKKKVDPLLERIKNLYKLQIFKVAYTRNTAKPAIIKEGEKKKSRKQTSPASTWYASAGCERQRRKWLTMLRLA